MRGRAATSSGVALLRDPAVLDDQHPGGERERVEGVVGDQHGDPGVRREVAAELDPQRRGHADVEPGERLVEQQQRGVGGERARDRHPLGLAAGELARPPAGEVAQPDPGQPVAGRGPGLGAPGPSGPGAEGDVVEGGEVREEHLVLEDHPDRAVPRRERQQVDAAEAGVPGGGHQAGQGVQQRGLAGAVGADHGHHVARLRGERQVDPARHPQVEVERAGHETPVPSHRSRSATSTPIEIASITRLSAWAAWASDWRAT